MAKNILLIVLVLVLIALIVKNFIYVPKTSSMDIEINGTKFNLEIARTLTQRAKGLSDRQTLPKNSGMIFVSPNDGIQPFWMKDTLIPLDMIWLDSIGKVVTIHTAQPEPGVPLTKLKLYKNEVPARFVIELNAGVSKEIGLEVGQVIKLPSNL